MLLCEVSLGTQYADDSQRFESKFQLRAVVAM